MVLKTTTAVLLFFGIVPTALAGWFSPSPPEVVLNGRISVQVDEASEFTLNLDERSTYQCYLALKPKTDFHGTAGKEIQWGQALDFSVHFKYEGKSHFTYKTTEILDHSLGFGCGTLQAPSDIPYGSYTLSISFSRFSNEFSSIYSEAQIRITKLPYFRFLD